MRFSGVLGSSIAFSLGKVVRDAVVEPGVERGSSWGRVGQPAAVNQVRADPTAERSLLRCHLVPDSESVTICLHARESWIEDRAPLAGHRKA
jgi:hypothetical protein